MTVSEDIYDKFISPSPQVKSCRLSIRDKVFRKIRKPDDANISNIITVIVNDGSLELLALQHGKQLERPLFAEVVG